MRPSVALRALVAAGHIVAQTVVGCAFMVGGSYLVYWALQHEDHKFAYVGIGAALFGALIFPSIYPIAQKVIVLVFPNGLPFIGGKPANNPPAPPTPPFDFKGGP